MSKNNCRRVKNIRTISNQLIEYIKYNLIINFRNTLAIQIENEIMTG